MTMRSYLASVLVAWLGASAQEAAGPELSPATFSAGLERIRKSADKGRWKSAREKLLKLLETHRGRTYLRAKAPEILEEMKRCVFGESGREPAPKDVVSGDLLNYNRSSGAFKIRYTPANLGDFSPPRGNKSIDEKIAELKQAMERLRKRSGAFKVHPARFISDCSIEIKGDKFPGTGSVQPPAALVGLQPSGNGYGVMY